MTLPRASSTGPERIIVNQKWSSSPATGMRQTGNSCDVVKKKHRDAVRILLTIRTNKNTHIQMQA